MAQFEQRGKGGSLLGTVTVEEATLKADPEAVLKLRTAKGEAAPPPPSGYDYVTSVEGDVDAMVSDCMVHVFARKGSYRKEEPGGLAALKASKAPAEVAK